MKRLLKGARVVDPVGGIDGRFDVLIDGNLIFSKHKEGRFPEEDDIIRSLPD